MLIDSPLPSSGAKFHLDRAGEGVDNFAAGIFTRNILIVMIKPYVMLFFDTVIINLRLKPQ